jgi:SET domain-containing protein
MNSENVEVKDSPIQGKGLFARRDIKEGETVLAWDVSHPVTEEEFSKMNEGEKAYVAKYRDGLILVQEPERYINHSCEPNTRSEDGKDIAIRDIREGEEVTSNYSQDLADGEEMECLCKTASCKGIIKNDG